jgi:hypothetical protein
VEIAMPRKVRILVGTLVVSMCLVVAAFAWASETFTVNAYFAPDRLGAPTNLSANVLFSPGAGVPTPVSKVVAYGPAGLAVDVRGAGTCEKAKLEQSGPRGCPSDSRIGFGGGVGLVELAKEIIKEPFTFDLFLAPKENGHLVILVYVNAVSPVSLELVLVGKEVKGPKPYGLGFSVVVPPIPTLPEAAYASVERSYITVGSANVAYYNMVNGRKKLVHVRGVIVPRTCPAGGFPFEATIGFLDGTSSTGRYAAPCPRP